MKKTILYTLLLIFLGSILYAEVTLEASSKAISLWFHTLLPSFLFPLIIVRLLSPYHLFYRLLRPFQSIISFLFQMDLYTFEIIFTSLFLGFPSASLYIEEHLPNTIDTSMYERIMYIPFMASPNFILLSLAKLYDSKTLYSLFLIQVCTIFTLLFLTRKNEVNLPIQTKKTVFFTQFSTSIQNSFQILFTILAYITIVYVILAIVNIALPSFMMTPLQILAEFASGCFFIETLSLPYFYKILFTSILLSYGGLCVHLQLISSLSSKFEYKTFMKYRIKHMIIAMLYTLLFIRG